MDTIQSTRRANLGLLLQEIVAELGTERGAAAELARRSGVAASQISQTSRQVLHQGQKPRKIGDDTARKLERGMNKHEGWMDMPHDVRISREDEEVVGSLQALTPSQRALIEQQIREFARLNRVGFDPTSTAPGARSKGH